MSENKIKLEDVLFTEEPIVANRTLARCIGLTEAVIFQQINYWLKINKKQNNNFIDGKYWTYNSIEEWRKKDFDFLSYDTIKRTLSKLEKLGLLESNCFNKMKGDKTKWYTIKYDDVASICNRLLKEKQIKSIERSNRSKAIALSKKEKMNTISASCPDGKPLVQVAPMVSASCPDGKCKLPQPIPEITTETSTKTSTCSSSNESLIDIFEDNICKLGVRTKVKFLELIKKESKEYIESVIEYQANINTRSFAGFEKGFDNFKSNNIHTQEELNIFLEKFKNQKRKSKKVTKPKSNNLRFNDFKQRDYNYDILEKKLLGWKDAEIAESLNITLEELNILSKGIEM